MLRKRIPYVVPSLTNGSKTGNEKDSTVPHVPLEGNNGTTY
jgi:hypothetical protein